MQNAKALRPFSLTKCPVNSNINTCKCKGIMVLAKGLSKMRTEIQPQKSFISCAIMGKSFKNDT